MTSALPSKIFITGTDTGVGKTFVSAVLMSGINAAYWKPIRTGAKEFDNGPDWMRQYTALSAERFLPEVYVHDEPLSPHLTSQMDGVRIDLSQFVMPDTRGFDYLIVEGAGGVMVPINEDKYIIDIIKQLQIPSIIVARSALGTINHTLMTINQLRQWGCPIYGVVMDGPLNPANRQAIEYYGKVDVIAEIEYMENITPDNLKQLFAVHFAPLVGAGVAVQALDMSAAAHVFERYEGYTFSRFSRHEKREMDEGLGTRDEVRGARN